MSSFLLFLTFPGQLPKVRCGGGAVLGFWGGDVSSWPWLCCGTQTVREAGKGGAAGLGRPRQGRPLGPRSTLRVRAFSWFTKNLAVVAWLDFEGCRSRERALGGEPAGCLQGLT